MFDGHAPAVFHVLRGFGASAETAEDIIGDVFLRLIEDRGACLSKARFSDERQFRRWLIVLAKHRLLDTYRQAAMARGVDPTELAESNRAVPFTHVDDPSDLILEEIDTRAEFDRVLALVSPQERFMVKLYYMRGLKLREIAELTRRPIGAVSAIIFRAREKMRGARQENAAEERSINGGRVCEETA